MVRHGVVMGVVALSGMALGQGALWDFEGEEVTWRPRMETVTVERVEGIGASEESQASLHVHGRIEGGWNYVTSDSRPMQEGQLYRLSAWVRVDSLGEGTPLPYLKCEFVGEEGSGALGRANTEAYDGAKLGEWQELWGEFRAPAGTRSCWIALEKGTSEPTEIDCTLDDVRIEPIEKLTMYERYRLDPLPAPMARLKGKHPRIYLTEERVAELREAIKTTHAPLWEEVKAEADRAVKSGPPTYREDDGHSGAEQLWQRGVGNTMPVLAMAYVLSGEQQYLDAARAWALASCGYPTWGLGSTDGMDLAAGHQLFGLGIVYDWCYEGLGEEVRTTIRETLVRRTSAMFEAAVGGKAWWRNSYLQNHLWVDVCGMSVAGFALYDEVEDATLWIGLPLEKFTRTMEALGPDGASHEGAGYWQYGVEYMMKFLHLSGQLLGTDIVGDGQWWRNTAAYCQYLMVPRNAWTGRSSLVDIADCPRGNWYGPDYLLRGLAATGGRVRDLGGPDGAPDVPHSAPPTDTDHRAAGLAWEYRDGHAQWLAEQVDEANIDSAGARWLNLVWYDPSVAAVPPTDLPTLRHFDDMDIVSARSDWSGDESLVVFKCGPFIGHEAIQAFTYDPGGGHVHPDAGHFVVFGNGEWLVRDDGYRAKWTGQHNTLLVEGRGQLGEGQQWFNGSECLAVKARPRIIKAESTVEYDHIVGDATQAYPRDSGLKRFVRQLLFVKPDALIVVDDIECEGPRELELRFHPEAKQVERDGDAFIVRGEKAVLRVELLTAEGVALAAEDVAGEGRGGGDFSMFTVSMRKTGERWRNVTALTWAAVGEEPQRVRMRSGEGGAYELEVGGKKVRAEVGARD